LAIIIAGTGTFAQQQTTSRPGDQTRTQPTQTQRSAPAARTTAGRMTIVGCVQPQSAYLQSQGGSTGRVASGGNQSNEFVLIEMWAAADSTASVTDKTATGTTASAGVNREPGYSSGKQATDRYGSQPSVPAGGDIESTPSPSETTSARADTSASTSAGATSNTSVGTSGSNTAYSLTGHAADLRRLSGKRVEIVGTMNRASTNAPMQSITVVTVREVPGTCDTP